MLGVFGVDTKGVLDDPRGHRWLNDRTGGHGKTAQPEGLVHRGDHNHTF